MSFAQACNNGQKLSSDAVEHSRDRMETHLTYDNKGNRLGLLVKQKLTTRDNLQVKVELDIDVDAFVTGV